MHVYLLISTNYTDKTLSLAFDILTSPCNLIQYSRLFQYFSHYPRPPPPPPPPPLKLSIYHITDFAKCIFNVNQPNMDSEINISACFFIFFWTRKSLQLSQPFHTMLNSPPISMDLKQSLYTTINKN